MDFDVSKPLYHDGKLLQMGETIALPSHSPETEGLVARGCLAPSDLPEIGCYTALRAFELPGKESAYRAALLEVVELTDCQALELMLAGKVIPLDDEQWRPRDRRLKTITKGQQ